MTGPARIIFVCWGNICRSPMAEVVARAWAAREGVRGVAFSSAGISDEEHGNPMDPRAVATLREAGYTPGAQRAHRITTAEIGSAGLLIGMEQLHLDRMRRLAPHADHLYLLSDFDPDAVPGSGIPDPWYGPDDAFTETLEAIEAAMPEVMKRARELASEAAP